MDMNKGYLILRQINPDQLRIDEVFKADNINAAREKARKISEKKYPTQTPFYIVVKVIDIRAGRQKL